MGASFTWLAFGEKGSNDNFEISSFGDPIRRPSVRNFALNERTGGLPGDQASVDPSMMDVTERSRHFRDAGTDAAGVDLHEALSNAAQIDSKKDRADYLRGVFSAWAEVDPEGALDHALTGMGAGQLQSDAIGIAINRWGQNNPREAWLWAEKNLSGPLKERALTDLMMGWTRRNPQDAADWLASTGLTSQPFFNALPGTWAEFDPQGALAWADSLPPGKARDTAEVAIAGTVAQHDPSAAAEMFSDRVDAGQNPALAITIADIWATTDPAAAAKWVSSMAEGAGKTEAAATLATVWAASDIRAAVEWSASISNEDMRRQVVSHIGTTWGAIDPYEALQWLGSLPMDAASDGITGAMYSWAGTDPVGLREWIGEATGDPLVDRARQSLADVLSQEMMPDALDVAMGMESPVARDAALERYYREWRKTDDAGAQDWLDMNWSSLPDSSRTALEKVQAQVLQPK